MKEQESEIALKDNRRCAIKDKYYGKRQQNKNYS